MTASSNANTSGLAPTDALRLVPVEPTEAMLKAAFAAMNATLSGEWKRLKAENKTPREIFDAKMRPRWSAMLAAAPASPLPGDGTSYAAGGLDVLSRIRSRLTEQIDRAEADLNSTVTIRLNDAKAIRHMLAPAAPTGDA